MIEKKENSITPQHVALIEEKIRLQNVLKAGANNFYWIAGLSIINSASLLVRGNWSFFIGLGVTQIIDGIAIAIAKEVGTNAGTLVRGIAFMLNLGIAGIFVGFGFLAGKKYKWAFVVGMILYALDGLIFLAVGDYLALGFHVLVLFWLYTGLKPINRLTELEKAGVQLPANVIASANPPQKNLWKTRLILVIAILFVLAFLYFISLVGR